MPGRTPLQNDPLCVKYDVKLLSVALVAFPILQRTTSKLRRLYFLSAVVNLVAWTSAFDCMQKSNLHLYDLLWICRTAVASHRLDRRHFYASDFIYFSLMISATANDVQEFDSSDRHALE